MINCGDHRGATGRVLRVDPKQNRAIVEGINWCFRHQRRTVGRPGGRVRFEAPLHISNMQVLDKKTRKPTRIRHRIERTNGKDSKFRISSDGNVIDEVTRSSTRRRVIQDVVVDARRTTKSLTVSPGRNTIEGQPGRAQPMKRRKLHPDAELVVESQVVFQSIDDDLCRCVPAFECERADRVYLSIGHANQDQVFSHALRLRDILARFELYRPVVVGPLSPMMDDLKQRLLHEFIRSTRYIYSDYCSRIQRALDSVPVGSE